MDRRKFLGVTSGFLVAGTLINNGYATVINSRMPWSKDATKTNFYPNIVEGVNVFLTDTEMQTIEAIADCFIPADELSIGGKEAGCAVFIDHQLAGKYGEGLNRYQRGPLIKGVEEQGPQYSYNPREIYRLGLEALSNYCQQQYGQAFPQLPLQTQNAILTTMEKGTLPLEGEIPPKVLFEILLKNIREGYLADPLYGGNRGMASWKMLGFPGARYEYRDVMDLKGQNLHIEPRSILTQNR